MQLTGDSGDSDHHYHLQICAVGYSRHRIKE